MIHHDITTSSLFRCAGTLSDVRTCFQAGIGRKKKSRKIKSGLNRLEIAQLEAISSGIDAGLQPAPIPEAFFGEVVEVVRVLRPVRDLAVATCLSFRHRDVVLHTVHHAPLPMQSLVRQLVVLQLVAS